MAIGRCLVASAKGSCTCVAARRVSARLPSNFLLLAQKEVTKEECPNTSHLVTTLRTKADCSVSGTRTPAEDPTGTRR